jgi:hypothetical protein
VAQVSEKKAGDERSGKRKMWNLNQIHQADLNWTNGPGVSSQIPALLTVNNGKSRQITANCAHFFRISVIWGRSFF